MQPTSLMRRMWLILGLATAITAHPGSARVSADALQNYEVKGFRIGMTLAEADAALRKYRDIEEATSEYIDSFDCNELIGDQDSGAAVPSAQIPISFYIDDRDHHVADVFFDGTPAGPKVSSIWYGSFAYRKTWPISLAYATKQFGKPDVVRSERNGGYSAFWCQRGDDSCASDSDYWLRIGLMWNPVRDTNESAVGSGTLVIDESHEAGEAKTAQYIAAARRYPTVGKKMFDQCRLANGWVFDRADAERRQGNLIALLDTWSPAISEPRLVDGHVLQASGFDPKTLMESHDCAIRRHARLSDYDCPLNSRFRWMRNKGKRWLIALQETGLSGYKNKAGSSSNTRLSYCLIAQEDNFYEAIWSGESLVDLSEWLQTAPDRSEKTAQCQ